MGENKTLTEEEKRKIYEEEKAKIEARERIEKEKLEEQRLKDLPKIKKQRKTTRIILVSLLVFIVGYYSIYYYLDNKLMNTYRPVCKYYEIGELQLMGNIEKSGNSKQVHVYTSRGEYILFYKTTSDYTRLQGIWRMNKDGTHSLVDLGNKQR